MAHYKCYCRICITSFIFRAHITWEKLNRLEEIKFKIYLELQHKRETLEIDLESLHLNRTCANISYKLNALRTSEKYVF